MAKVKVDDLDKKSTELDDDSAKQVKGGFASPEGLYKRKPAFKVEINGFKAGADLSKKLNDLENNR